jgi:hypothetical protein
MDYAGDIEDDAMDDADLVYVATQKRCKGTT